MTKEKENISEQEAQQNEAFENVNTDKDNTPESTPDLNSEMEIETEFETKSDVDVDALIEENKKLREDYLRAFADAENTKKRAQQEIEKNNKYAISSFGKGLLSVADNLQRAIDSVKDQNVDSCEILIKGVELTQEELLKVFGRFNIKKMEIMDTVFDPNFHQVVQEVEDKTKPAGTIIAELQSGYMINDRILREAMVVVTK